MSLLIVRPPGAAFMLLALVISGCSDSAPEPAPSPVASPDLRRISFERGGESSTETTLELVGHIDPSEGIETWEVVSPGWSFEDSGARKRPLRLTGQGKKLVTIPGPFSLGDFDRITVMVENPVPGSMLVTLKLNGGEEIQAREDVQKGRYPHPVTFELPRSVAEGEAIESLVLYLDINRAVTIHGFDFARQPMVATVPSPETGPGLVKVGTAAHRAVGLSADQTLKASWTGDKGANATVWVAGMQEGELWTDDDAQVSLQLVHAAPVAAGEPQVAPVTRTVPLLPGWTPVSFLGLASGAYSLEVSLESADEGTVAVVSELRLAGPAAAEPATVLLITSSAHRADHLGTTSVDGDQPVDTPNLDALAANGMLFDSAWTTSNETIPSHSALLTGRHPRDTKVLSNYMSLGADPEFSPKTLAEEFAAKGFATVAVLSSAHLAHGASGLGRGFDVVIQPEGAESRAARSIKSVLAQLRGGTPTFVWLHLFDAHGPYMPPPEFDRRYYPKDKDPLDPALPEIDLEGGSLPPWLSGVRDHAYPRAQYRAEIAYLDSQIGVLMADERVAKGLVVFTSDHGEVFARNGVFYGSKGLTPDTLRVPIIFSGPGLSERGRRVSVAVRQSDVGRTLLNRAGFGTVDFPGDDLLVEELPDDEPFFAVSSRFASVTQGQWHAILTLSDLSGSKDGRWAGLHQLEVYDLSADPECLKDLAAEKVDVAGRYHKVIVDWLAAEDRMLRASRPTLDKAARENLAALGYGGGPGRSASRLYDPGCSCSECLKFK